MNREDRRAIRIETSRTIRPLASVAAATRSVRYRTPPTETDRVRVAWIDGPWVFSDVFDDGLPYAVVCEPDRGIGYDGRRAFWRDVVRKDPCCYCGRPVTPHRLPDGSMSRLGSRGTTEHLVAKAFGGRGLDGNTVGACAACNHSRFDLTLLDMLLRERDGVTIVDLAKAAKNANRRAA